MNNFKGIFFLIFSIFSTIFSFSQSDVDSLEIALKLYPDAEANTLILLAHSLKDEDAHKALAYSEKAMLIATTSGNRSILLDSYLIKANIFWRISDYKAAIKNTKLAITLSKQLNMDSKLASALRIYGLIYIELSNYEKSSTYFFRSLKIYEDLQDSIGKLSLLSDIGSVNFFQNSYDKALEYYFKSLNLSKETKYKIGIARALNNIAAVYETMEKYDEAGKYFEQAKEMNQVLSNKRNEGINDMNLGTIYLRLGNPIKSLDHFKSALQIFENIKSKILIARCHINLAKFYFENDELNQSITYAKLALQEGKEEDLKQIVHDAAETLQEAYFKRNDITKAYEYIKLQYQMKDSLILLSNKAELSKLELQYKFDKKEQANRIRQQRKDKYVLIIIISLLIALILILLIFFRQRVRAKNSLLKQQELEYKLEAKNKKLTLDVMSLMKKNDLLTNISNKLSSIKQQAVKEETKYAINKISQEIQKITDEEIFEEFQMRFKEVHTDFYENLLLRFPKLSPNELRLCAFLRLNMSSKEISVLTGQRISTLETARYRLRKKLGITNSKTNLVTFLSNV